MNKLVLLSAFVCAMLVSIGANAAEWHCHVFGDMLRDGKWYERKLDLDVDIKEKTKAEEYGRQQWEAMYAPDPAKRRGVVAECEPVTKRTVAATGKTWTCRVVSRWMAVFGANGTSTLRRGTAHYDEAGIVAGERSTALALSVGAHKLKLTAGALKGGRAIVVTLIAGDCWTDTKPPKPIGWPSNITW